MALKSSDVSLDLVKKLESEVDELSIELNGEVYLVQSKNNIPILRDKMDSKVVVEVLKLFMENAMRDKIAEIKS